MTSWLSRAFGALRIWLGLNDPAENHRHPWPGGPLPHAPTGRVVALAPALATVPSTPGMRS
jgi:hypothetical protein